MSACYLCVLLFSFFFFNDTATTEIYTLSLHDALPISRPADGRGTPAGGHDPPPAGRRPRGRRRRSRRAWLPAWPRTGACSVPSGRRAGAQGVPQNAQGPAAIDWPTGPYVRKDPAASYSPTRRPCSTIGAGGLNGRVRDGNGCFPSAITAGNRITSWTGRSSVESKRVVAHTRQNYGQASRPFSTG